MIEVFTIGGGEYIVNTFNAVAAWTGGGGYKSLIKVVLVIGLVYALLAVAFSMNVRAWLNWFLGATMIYLCLMVPTIDVKVTDRINPGLAPATVANVPLGLGVMASFTSQVGDYLTRTAETVFTMPNQLNYSTNGMIYGSRLFDATRNFQIRDVEFATNLQAHFKQCVFGDILLHQKSLTDLASSQDLWTDLGPGSEARAQAWLDRSGGAVTSSVVTCRQAYDLLTAQWESVIDAHTPLWGKEVFPKLTNALAANKLRSDVPIANTAFTNATSDFTATMRQSTAISAFMQARDAMAGGSASAAIDTFATTRADLQARNTYNSIAQQAMSWVPILNVVLTVVFYAMFPVIFPLFLMPQTGPSTLKGYVTGFFYLASWGPLYVILHMICMSRGETAAQGVADGGVTLSTFAGIGAVNAETATIAGFMLMSVPFIAGGLARGAMGISSQATSILAPAQNAAEAAALEQTTGNYSYGNVSFANSTSNMRQSNKWADDAVYSTGDFMTNVRGANGSMYSTFDTGKTVADGTPGMSKLPVNISIAEGYVAEQRQQSSMMVRRAESLENSAAEIRSHVHTDRNARSRTSEVTSGVESASGSQSGTSLEQSDRTTGSTFEGIDNRSSTGQSSRINESHAVSARGVDQTRGGVSVDMGFGGFGGKGGRGGGKAGDKAGDKSGGEGDGGRSDRLGMPGLGLSGGRTWTATQEDGLSRDTARSRSTDDSSSTSDGMRNEHTVGDSASVSSGTYSRSGSFSRASQTSSSSVSQEEQLSLAESFEKRARDLREKAESLSNDASWAESHNMQMSENMSQELYEWYRNEAAKLPNGIEAPALDESSLSSSQRQVRDGLIARFLNERREGVYDFIEDWMKEPDLGNLSAPSVASEADVVQRYRSLGTQGLPSGGADDGAGDLARERVATGRDQLQSEQEAKRIVRGGSVAAGSGVRGEVDGDLNRGFFSDPKLRP